MADFDDSPHSKGSLFECSFQLLFGLNFANLFLWGMLHGLFFGGYGLYGATEENGQYLLYFKDGKSIAVSKLGYSYSTWHTQTLIWLFGVMCVGVLLAAIIEGFSTLRQKLCRRRGV